MHTTSRLRSNTVPQYFLLFGAGVVESYFHNGATLAHAGKEHSDNDNTVCGSLSVFTGIKLCHLREPTTDLFCSVAHVTTPISGIFSECSIFFIEDSFYTHQSFIARLYILYIIYEIYISICKSPACLNFLILKLETSFLI